MRRGQAVVVAVHLAGQVQQRLAVVAGRPAGEELVAVDHRPRDVRDDVDDDRQDDEAEGRVDDRDPEQPARPQPALRRGCRRFQAARRDRPVPGGLASGPNPTRPPSQNRPATTHRAEGERERDLDRRDRDGPDARSRWLAVPARDGDEEDERADRRRDGDREAHLVVRPGDRVEDRGDHADERQRDHDQQEREVAEALALGHGDREVAQDGRDPDHPQDRHDPTERTPDEDQQDERPDGVGRHPLRGEAQAQQEPDHGHRQPERPATRATSPSRRPRTACRPR